MSRYLVWVFMDPNQKTMTASVNVLIQDLKINMVYLCCTKTVELKGLLRPNKNFYTKTVNGNYWAIDGKQTTINTEFQHLRIDSDKAGTGRAPFSCVVPYLSGPKTKKLCPSVLGQLKEGSPT